MKKRNARPQGRKDAKKKHYFITYYWTTFDKPSFSYTVSKFPDAIDHIKDLDKFKSSRDHVKSIKYLIQVFSNVSDIILDPFAGTGTTLVAAKSVNRKFIGIERDDIAMNIIRERLK